MRYRFVSGRALHCRSLIVAAVLCCTFWSFIGIATGQAHEVYPPPAVTPDATIVFWDGSPLQVIRFTFGSKVVYGDESALVSLDYSRLPLSGFDASTDPGKRLMLEVSSMASRRGEGQRVYLAVDFNEVQAVRAREIPSLGITLTVADRKHSMTGVYPAASQCSLVGTRTVLGQPAAFSLIFPGDIRTLTRRETAMEVTNYLGDSVLVEGADIQCRHPFLIPHRHPFVGALRFQYAGGQMDLAMSRIRRIEFQQPPSGVCQEWETNKLGFPVKVTTRREEIAEGTLYISSDYSAYTLAGHLVQGIAAYKTTSGGGARCMPALRSIDFADRPWSLARFADQDAELVVRASSVARALSQEEKKIRLRLVVSEKGKIVRILDSPHFVEPTKSLVDLIIRDARFRPAKQNGRDVSVSLEYPLGGLAGQ